MSQKSCPAAGRIAAFCSATRRVQRCLPLEDGLVGEVERSEKGHGEDHIVVLASLVDIAEAVVRDDAKCSWRSGSGWARLCKGRGAVLR